MDNFSGFDEENEDRKMPSVCRICLAGNMSLHFVKNNLLQSFYEKLTDAKFNSEDARPRALCSFCYQKLLRCHTFSQMALRSEKIFSHLYDRGLEATHEYITEVNLNMKQHLSVTTIPFVTIDVNATNAGSQVTIKDEPLPSIDMKEEVTTEPHKLMEDESFPGNCSKSQINFKEDISDRENDGEEHISTDDSYFTFKDEPLACIVMTEELPSEPEKLLEVESPENFSESQITFQGDNSDQEKEVEEYFQKIHVELTKPDNTKMIFSCNNCNKIFYIKSKLISLIRNSHSKIKRKQYFSTKKNTETSMIEDNAIHNKKKKFACHVCDISFYSKHTLTHHLRIHTRDKPFACNVCVKQFHRKRDLVSHIRTHTGEKPFVCHECDKRYNRKDNTEAGSKDTSEQVIKITDNAEETTNQLNEKTDTKQLKEKTVNVHEININYVKEGNTTGETSQSRKNNTEVGFESDGTDFSGTDIDTDKNFVPDKRLKRKIIPSSSSSSSSSSTSSSRSDSESTKSINLLNIPNQTNTQLLDAHVPSLIMQQIATQDSNYDLNTEMTSQIVQQIATQDSNNESNTEMTSQFDCEFQNTPVPTKAKKRAKNSDAWKKNKRKALRNSGQEHTSSTGKNIPAKKMGSPCTEKCLYSCSKIISDEHRQKLFEEYWKLGCLKKQRDFVASCITTLASEYRRLKSKPKFARKPNSCFHLTINGDKVRVCKTFLMRTLAITPRFLRHIIDKRTETGIVPPDKRGTLTKKRIRTEIHESVRAHINSIQKIESQSRHYIDGQYTVAELHRLYCEERKANDKPCATYDFYNRVFNQEFNISFFTPKKDQFDQCVSYHNLSSAEQLKKEDEYKLHLKETKTSSAS